MMLMWFMICNTFFLNTWEEYYTGILELPIIHGVSEGTLVTATLMIYTGINGQDFWMDNITVMGSIWRRNNFTITMVFILSSLFGTLR